MRKKGARVSYKFFPTRADRKAARKPRARNRPEYCERMMFTRCGSHVNVVCFDCRKSMKGSRGTHCPHCGKEMKSLGLTGRAPKKDASNFRWKEFEKFYAKGDFHPRYCR